MFDGKVYDNEKCMDPISMNSIDRQIKALEQYVVDCNDPEKVSLWGEHKKIADKINRELYGIPEDMLDVTK